MAHLLLPNPPTIVMAVARIAGMHCWKDAPPAVAYLANRHRHLFTMRGEWRVLHDDRDVEFHIARGWILELCNLGVRRGLPEAGAPCGAIDFGNRSCEQIAKELHAAFVQSPWPSPIAIEVWEDDENGARVQFE